MLITGEELTMRLRAGSKSWNNWVDANDEDVELVFLQSHLTEVLNNPDAPQNSRRDIYDFTFYKFPRGIIKFEGLTFSTNVSFRGCDFGFAHVSFTDSKFNGQTTDFTSAKFNGSFLNFSHTEFTGKSFFHDVTFNTEYITFLNAKFIGKIVSFINTTFNAEMLVFSHVTIESKEINFQGSTLAYGTNAFNNLDCKAELKMITVKVLGSLSFNESSFTKGIVCLSNMTFGHQSISFQSALFKNHFMFKDSLDSNSLLKVEFQKSVFERSVDLSGNSFNCVPDFTLTSFNNQFSFKGLSCTPQFEKKPIYPKLYAFFNTNSNSLIGRIKNWISEQLFFDHITDPDDTERLCRLKELSEDNKDHERALNFHADELRAKRTVNPSLLKVGLDHLYQVLSDYGRSVLRPGMWLICSWFFFACIYFNMSDVNHFHLEVGDKLIAALSYSGGYTVPLLPDGRFSRLEGLELLFEGKSSGCLHLLNFFQGLISTAFIFLIGLGLRNRFRI